MTTARERFRPRGRVRIGLIQLTCALAGLVLGLLVPLSHIGPELHVDAAVQAMVTMGLGIVGLIAVVFTLLFTVVQWVYGAFSLRLRLFEDDPLTWWVFGLGISVFVYSMAATGVVWTATAVQAIVPGVAFAGVLVTLVMMRQLQLRAFLSVQLSPTLHRVTMSGLASLDTVYSHPMGATTHGSGAPFPSPTDAVLVAWLSRPETLQQIDAGDLLAVAVRHDTTIDVLLPAGAPLNPGTDWASTSPVAAADPALVRALVTGDDRTFQQDPGLAVRLLTDIGLRALSPAVNDPATAVQAMDAIEPILVRIVGATTDPAVVLDQQGRPRVRVAVAAWDDLLAEALDDLVVCAANLPLSHRRLRRLLVRLAEAAPADRRPMVLARLEQLDAMPPRPPVLSGGESVRGGRGDGGFGVTLSQAAPDPGTAS